MEITFFCRHTAHDKYFKTFGAVLYDRLTAYKGMNFYDGLLVGGKRINAENLEHHFYQSIMLTGTLEIKLYDVIRPQCFYHSQNEFAKSMHEFLQKEGGVFIVVMREWKDRANLHITFEYIGSDLPFARYHTRIVNATYDNLTD